MVLEVLKHVLSTKQAMMRLKRFFTCFHYLFPIPNNTHNTQGTQRRHLRLIWNSNIRLYCCFVNYKKQTNHLTLLNDWIFRKNCLTIVIEENSWILFLECIMIWKQVSGKLSVFFIEITQDFCREKCYHQYCSLSLSLKDLSNSLFVFQDRYFFFHFDSL